MKKNVCYIFIPVFFLLSACTENINSPIIHFNGKPIEKIYPSKIVSLWQFGVLRPFFLVQIDDSTFVFQDNKSVNVFNWINLSSGKVISGVNIGQGPDEILSSTSLLYRHNKVLSYDSFKKKMSEIVVSSDTTLAIKEVFMTDPEIRILYVVNQLDSTVFATGEFDDYWLVEMNIDGKIISAIDFPIWEETKDISKYTRTSLFRMTKMANSPDNKKVVAVTSSQGVISFLNRTESGIKEYKQINYYAPKFNVTERGVTAFSRDNVEGFKAVDCDDMYIYTIYSGRTFNSHQSINYHCEHLLVYDWDGNPIRRYILDLPIYNTIIYNKKTNSIYGLADNPEGVLVEYKL